MSARKKTKLCWHCHGTIPAEATHCAYCGEHCESPQPTAASYFPPLTQEDQGGREHSADSDEITSPLHPKTTNWNRLTKRFHLGLSALVKFGRNEPACSFLFLSWGIFLAFLAIGLSLFTSGDRLQIELSARYWWAYGLAASAMIWFGSLLPKE